MIVDVRPPKKSLILEVTVLVSIFMHGFLWAGLTRLGTQPIRDSYLARLVLDESPKPEPPAPTPEPENKPKPKPTPPPPLDNLPPPNKEAKDVDPTEQAKPIFGVTQESVIEDGSFSVRVGNTLMKAQEKEFTDPSLVRPYSGGSYQKAIKVSAPPKLRKMVPPEYPALAKQTGREGRVVLKVLISKSGAVITASIVKVEPIGLGFEQAAMEVIKQWLYSPPGEGQDIWFFQPIKFNLEG